MTEFTGKILGIVNNAFTGELQLTLSVDQRETLISDYDSLKDQKLCIKLGKPTRRRSLDANGMLWACIGRMARALGCDKWSVYLMMLRRYGQYTFAKIEDAAVPSFKRMWRECEEVGHDNGYTHILCYFGSSTYTSKEFAHLLDGVVSEMREMGLTPPPSKEMQKLIEEMDINNSKR